MIAFLNIKLCLGSSSFEYIITRTIFNTCTFNQIQKWINFLFLSCVYFFDTIFYKLLKYLICIVV